MHPQPVDLSKYPFDSLDLLVLLQFQDTSGEDHPGVNVHVSSGGTQASAWVGDIMGACMRPPPTHHRPNLRAAALLCGAGRLGGRMAHPEHRVERSP